jgi:hypothetical protein
MIETHWLSEDWRCLCALLPEGWREAARECGALRRAREIKSADQLLRLLLLHAGPGLSLRQAVVRGHMHGLPKVSDVALLKRLRHSGRWLRWLCEAMLEEGPGRAPWRWLPAKYRLRAVDSTTVEEPGATGTDWRVHYSVEVPGLFCDQMEVTDARGGETLKRFTIAPSDLVLADRGYCRAPQLAHVWQGGGHFVVRWHSSAVPLNNEQGEPLKVLLWLRRLKGREPAERTVYAREVDIPLRLCAIRVSEEAAQREVLRIKESARKNGRRPGELPLQLCHFVVVLTSLPEKEASLRQVLNLYRLRWQIELAFKRLKSLLQTGHVPKYDEASARAWLQAKLLTCLLIERLLQESEIFSPWGFPMPEQQSME